MLASSLSSFYLFVILFIMHMLFFLFSLAICASFFSPLFESIRFYQHWTYNRCAYNIKHEDLIQLRAQLEIKRLCLLIVTMGSLMGKSLKISQIYQKNNRLQSK